MEYISISVLFLLQLVQLSQIEGCLELGPRGERGPSGVMGLPGPVGKCPQIMCTNANTVFEKGPQGDSGSTESCASSCSGIVGIPGPQGPQGERGDPGDFMSHDDAYRFVKHTIERTHDANWPSGPKGLPGRNISVLRFARPNSENKPTTSNPRAVRKRSRRSLSNFELDPDDQTLNRFDSPMETESKIKPHTLGVTILDDVNKLKTIGWSLPVGALVVTILPNRIPSSKRPHDMGMFMKVKFDQNEWTRMPMEFHGEKNFGSGDPTEDGRSYQSLVHDNELYGPDHLLAEAKPVTRKQIVLAPYPIPLTGGSLSTRTNADNGCHELGQSRLGISGFKALLVGQDMPLEKIVPWPFHEAPIVNIANQVLFSSWLDFIYGLPSKTDVGLFDLNGLPDLEPEKEKTYWLGGGHRFTCDAWQSNSATRLGLVWSWNMQNQSVKFNHASCDSIHYLMCFKLVRIVDR